MNITCTLVAICMILRRLVLRHEGVNSILGYIYTKFMRPWLLRILEFSSVESVTAPRFRVVLAHNP